MIISWNNAGNVRVLHLRALCAHPLPTPVYGNGAALATCILGSAGGEDDEEDDLWHASIVDSSLCRSFDTGEGLLGVSTHSWASVMAV